MTARGSLAHRVRQLTGTGWDGQTRPHLSNTARATREWYIMTGISILKSGRPGADDAAVLEAWRTSHPVTHEAFVAGVRLASTDSPPILRCGCETGQGRT